MITSDQIIFPTLNRVCDVQELVIPPGNRLERLCRDWSGTVQHSDQRPTSHLLALGAWLCGRSRNHWFPLNGTRQPWGKIVYKSLWRGGCLMMRSPTHPREMLAEGFLKLLGICQSAFAIRLGVSLAEWNHSWETRNDINPRAGECQRISSLGSTRTGASGMTCKATRQLRLTSWNRWAALR